MTAYFKILCGIIAAGLSIWSFTNDNEIVGCYWLAVFGYWVFNFVGG